MIVNFVLRGGTLYFLKIVKIAENEHVESIPDNLIERGEEMDTITDNMEVRANFVIPEKCLYVLSTGFFCR